MTTKYSSAWQERLDDTVQKILNREKFSYDLNADALYRQYKDQYTRAGKAAMTDTMGRAAALTGGYGNSYAQSAGQQAYHGYLQQLNDKVPQLQSAALDRYNAEGSRLMNSAGLLAQQEATDYSRYRDQLADRDAAFNKLLTLMTAYGYQPSAEEMAAAGMTQGHLNAIFGLNAPAEVSGGRSGAYDPEVAKQQRKLNKLGANLTVDGIYGPQTAAAEERYGSKTTSSFDPGKILDKYWSDNTKKRLGI